MSRIRVYLALVRMWLAGEIRIDRHRRVTLVDRSDKDRFEDVDELVENER